MLHPGLVVVDDLPSLVDRDAAPLIHRQGMVGGLEFDGRPQPAAAEVRSRLQVDRAFLVVGNSRIQPAEERPDLRAFEVGEVFLEVRVLLRDPDAEAEPRLGAVNRKFDDAAYLELAMRLGIPIETLDKDLRKSAKAEGVQLLGI